MMRGEREVAVSWNDAWKLILRFESPEYELHYLKVSMAADVTIVSKAEQGISL